MAAEGLRALRPAPSPERPASASALGGGKINQRTLLGVGLVVVCALAALAVYHSGRARPAVLVAARPVAAGQSLTPADVTVAHLSASGPVRAMAGAERSAVIGRRAAVALWPGEVLVSDQLSAGPTVAPGQVAMGLALRPGRFPSGLVAGDRVLLLVADQAGAAATQPAGADLSAAASAPVSGMVSRVQSPSASAGTETTRIDVMVPADAAPALADAAVADRLVVVVAP